MVPLQCTPSQWRWQARSERPEGHLGGGRRCTTSSGCRTTSSGCREGAWLPSGMAGLRQCPPCPASGAWPPTIPPAESHSYTHTHHPLPSNHLPALLESHFHLPHQALQPFLQPGRFSLWLATPILPNQPNPCFQDGLGPTPPFSEKPINSGPEEGPRAALFHRCWTLEGARSPMQLCLQTRLFRNKLRLHLGLGVRAKDSPLPSFLPFPSRKRARAVPIIMSMFIYHSKLRLGLQLKLGLGLALLLGLGLLGVRAKNQCRR